MGVEPFLIASSLAASLAQRLVRLLCNGCKEAYRPGDVELEEIGLERGQLEMGRLVRAKGCAACNQSGYRGRTGIFEILVADDHIRGMVTRGIDSKTIQEEAIRGGMTTMRMDGAQKVLRGLTSVSEIMRQTQEEAVAAPDSEAV